MNEKGFAVLEEGDKIAAEHGAIVALAWQLGLPKVNAPMIGANGVSQLAELLGACEVKLCNTRNGIVFDTNCSAFRQQRRQVKHRRTKPAL